MSILEIHSKIKDYQIEFADSWAVLDQIKSLDNRFLIVDANVYDLYREILPSLFCDESICLLEATEEGKTIEGAQKIYAELARASAKRNTHLVSIGGGIIQDLTGFVASTLYRGIPWTFVPTTFLAQTDSCLGSKTSLNFDSYKNLIGTFYPPNRILITPKFLDTLTERDFYSGLCESVKLQLMDMKSSGKTVSEIALMIGSARESSVHAVELVQACLNIKRGFLEGDEFDMGRRNLLNFGHCFGHALENSSDYYMPHGLAVNVGMVFANIVSVNRGILSSDFEEEIYQSLLLPTLRIALRQRDFDSAQILNGMEKDKKRSGADLTIVLMGDDFEFRKVSDFKKEEFSVCFNILVDKLFKGEASE